MKNTIKHTLVFIQLLTILNCGKKQTSTVEIPTIETLTENGRKNLEPEENEENDNLQLLDEFWYESFTGLGDRIIDLIGLKLISDITHKTIINVWRSDHPIWKYDLNSLNLDFLSRIKIMPHENIKKLKKKLQLKSNSTAQEMNPFTIARAMKIQKWEKLINKYKKIPKEIKFRDNITQRLPLNIKKATVLHMRKSDKITETETTFSITKKELDFLLKDLFYYCQKEISNGDKYFFIASEDFTWKKEISSIIEKMGGTILTTNYKEIDGAILDLAIMANAKKIFQGTNFSTLSIVASMIGNVPLYNFSSNKFYTSSLLRLWKPFINLHRPFDLEFVQRDYFSDTCFYEKYFKNFNLWPFFFESSTEN
jgi:hypothetical protein